MIINKDTSNAALVNSIRIFSSTGKPLKKIKEFNTATLLVTKDDDGTETAQDYAFFIDAADVETVEGLLDAGEHNKIVPGMNTGHGGVQSMSYNISDPDETLDNISMLVPKLIQCSACSTYFVAFLDKDGNLWSTSRAVNTDKHLTATQLDSGSLACDNCSVSVTYTP